MATPTTFGDSPFHEPCLLTWLKAHTESFLCPWCLGKKGTPGAGFTAGIGLEPAWSRAQQGGPGLVMVCRFKECLVCLVAWAPS